MAASRDSKSDEEGSIPSTPAKYVRREKKRQNSRKMKVTGTSTRLLDHLSRLQKKMAKHYDDKLSGR